MIQYERQTRTAATTTAITTTTATISTTTATKWRCLRQIVL
jgi:hypothetical protein